jgi:hypothetical protein
MIKIKGNKTARSQAYDYKSGVRQKTERISWEKLAKLADEGARRVEEKYGRYVEPSRVDMRARECA